MVLPVWLAPMLAFPSEAVARIAQGHLSEALRHRCQHSRPSLYAVGAAGDVSAYVRLRPPVAFARLCVSLLVLLEMAEIVADTGIEAPACRCLGELLERLPSSLCLVWSVDMIGFYLQQAASISLVGTRPGWTELSVVLG